MDDLSLSPGSAAVVASLLGRHPEWASYLGAEDVECPMCGCRERRFTLAIPSINPSYPEALQVTMRGCEAAFLQAVVYWAIWHDHVDDFDGDPAKLGREICEVIEEWTAGKVVFAMVFDAATNRPRRGWEEFPDSPDTSQPKRGEKLVRCSWTGKHDAVIFGPKRWPWPWGR